MIEKNKRHRMLLYDRESLREEGVDDDSLDRAYRKVTRSLQTGNTYFKIESSDGGRPETRDGIDTVIVTEEDRGYFFIEHESNDEYVDFAVMRMDYDREEEVIEPGVSKLIQFEYDELPDPTATPYSRKQFYFDLLKEAGDRSPEELISRLSTDFTPDYDVPERSQYRYD